MDPARPAADLVAVTGDRIVSVSGNGMLEQLRGPATKIVDCAGRTLLPGFVDAHCHIHAYAESLVSLNLLATGAYPFHCGYSGRDPELLYKPASGNMGARQRLQ